MKNIGFGNHHRKPQLHSLIDMAFILLLFFVIAMLFISKAGQEQVIALPTPENKPGEAQIAIQIIDANHVWVLGDEVREKAAQILALPLAYEQKRRMIGELLNSPICACDWSKAIERIRIIKQKAQNNPNEHYFVVIRCPENQPYSLVIRLAQELAGITNLQYGCVGGDVNEFINADYSVRRVIHQGGSIQDKLIIQFR